MKVKVSVISQGHDHVHIEVSAEVWIGHKKDTGENKQQQYCLCGTPLSSGYPMQDCIPTNLK
jgi:hypothetical protein